VPGAWTAAVHADLTGTEVALAALGGATKPAGTPATLGADAVLWPAQRRSDLRRLAVRLGDGTMHWAGSARIDWPRKEGEQPVGRFEGTLSLERIASAGAVLAPGRFDPAPPVSGGAVFDVRADLAEGRLRTHMEAGLERMDLALGDYLVKPAGQTASLSLTSLWHTGRWNHVEGEADLDLPGVHLSALGQATVAVRMEDVRPPARSPAPSPAGPPAQRAPQADAPAADADPERGRMDEPKPATHRSSLIAQLVSPTTVEVKAAVSDLRGAAAMSPLLERGLKTYEAAGRADGRVVLSMRTGAVIEAVGEVDLTQADLRLGNLLAKPPGQTLTARVAGDVTLRRRGRLALGLSTAEVHLGESVTRAAGQVRLDWAGLTAPVNPAARLAAALEEADVTVQADWRHGPALRRALPWLEPLAKRCGLEGATRWTLALSGTPTRGRFDLDVDATDCRVSAVRQTPRRGEAEAVTVKAAGVPASARLGVRYGEVPGEMVVEALGVRLAEAEATASGRLLFDDPRLLVPAPPTAWTLAIEAEVPDAAVLASLLPWRLADLEPTGAVAVTLRAAADAKGTEVESCRLVFDAARIRWFGRRVRLDGPVSYDEERLATDGLNLAVGGSDVRLVAYVSRPNDDPTGSVIVRGTALDLAEVQEMIRQTSESLALRSPGTGPYGPERVRRDEPTTVGGGGADGRLPSPLGSVLGRLLARAHLSADVRLDRVILVVPEWETRYDLQALEAEGRLAEGRLVIPRFACGLNGGRVTGRMRLDFREDTPVLDVTYDARDLAMDENLEPFIDTTFPGMKVFGTLSTRATLRQRLAEGAYPVGGGETVLTDGVLEGPAAPDYITRLLPGLKLTRYRFHRMSNVFENRPNGDTDNRMLFDGKAYDLFMFGVTRADGRTHYTVGVDLSVSLGSETISRTLDQGKLPLMHYDGRVVGSGWAEQAPSYVLPHEFAYDVFLRRNLLLQLIRSLGEPEPEIKKPLVVPKEEHRLEPRS